MPIITMNTFQRIAFLKFIGVWDHFVLPLPVAKLATLDRLYEIYYFINERRLSKKIPSIISSDDFIKQFGNQYDINYIYWLIRVMESHP